MEADMSAEAVSARLRAMDELWLLSVKLMNSRPVNDEHAPSRRTRASDIQDSIRRVLFEDWDPLELDGHAPADEYDAYIAPIYRILVGSRSEEDLEVTLRNIATNDLRVGAGSSEKLRSISRRLLELKVTLD